MNRTSSGVLPSWVPDWLSGDIPSQVYSLAAMTTQRPIPRFCLGGSIGQSSLNNGKVLQVKGLTVGRIATMTSSTNPTDVSLLCPGQSTSSVSFFDLPTSVHYTDCQVFTALLSCFTLTLAGQHKYFRDHSFWPVAFNARVFWHTFCLQCVPPQTKLSQRSQTSSNSETPQSHSKSILSRWLQANAKFQIHGTNLEEWTQERTSSCSTTVVRILDASLSCSVILAYSSFVGIATIIINFYSVANFAPPVRRLTLSVTISFWLVLFSVHVFNSYRSAIKESKRLWDDLTQLVKPGKRLFVADKGYIGIADDRVKIGDLLCNLVGCSEPVVLREMGGDRDGDNDRERRQRKKYAVVGKCYVHFTERELDQHLGPDPPDRNSTEKTRSKYEKKKEKWMSNPTKGTLHDFYLI